MSDGFTSQPVLGCTKKVISLDLLFSSVLSYLGVFSGRGGYSATTLQIDLTLWRESRTN